jgi:ABC-type polysaccharide/polyol phosphate export permease
MASAILSDLKEIGREQVEYRGLLYQMTRRDLLLRYKQTLMGVGWAVFMPLVNTAVFSVIFTRVAPIDPGVPYPVFAYCGLLAWNFSASSLRFAVNSLTSNANLVTKVYFPREIFPFSAVFVSLVDFAVGALVLVALMAYYRVSATPALVFLPVVILIHVMLTTGLALLLAMANLFYRDVKYLFEVIITIWMFATPVLYPTELVGGRLGAVLRLNPMTPIIDAYHAVILRGQLPPLGSMAQASLVSFTVFGLGWLLFHRAEYQFAENV